MQKTDLGCLWGNRLAHTTGHKVQTQEAVKDRYGNDFKAFKSSTSTPTSVSTQDSESSKKDKKKKHYQGKRDSREPKDSFTPATGVNAAEVVEGGQRKKNKKDISGVTCFNCNKKGYFSNKYPKSPKN